MSNYSDVMKSRPIVRDLRNKNRKLQAENQRLRKELDEFKNEKALNECYEKRRRGEIQLPFTINPIGIKRKAGEK